MTTNPELILIRQQNEEMLSILQQIFATLRDKSRNAPLNNLDLYEFGWYVAIEQCLKQADALPPGHPSPEPKNTQVTDI